MKLFAVYLITNDGRELLSEVYQSPKNIPNQTMLTSLLSAFQMMTADITKKEGGADKLSVAGIVYHFRNYGGFTVVLVTNSDESPSKVIDTIGFRFAQEYGEVLQNWMGNQTIFENFRDQIHEIVDEELKTDTSKSIDPSKPLDTVAIFSLPKELQSTALAITMLETATIEEIVKETNLDIHTVEGNLERLRKEGYLGVRQNENIKEFFAST